MHANQRHGRWSMIGTTTRTSMNDLNTSSDPLGPVYPPVAGTGRQITARSVGIRRIAMWSILLIAAVVAIVVLFGVRRSTPASPPAVPAAVQEAPQR